jgi:hypothetical protein
MLSAVHVPARMLMVNMSEAVDQQLAQMQDHSIVK